MLAVCAKIPCPITSHSSSTNGAVRWGNEETDFLLSAIVKNKKKESERDKRQKGSEGASFTSTILYFRLFPFLLESARKRLYRHFIAHGRHSNASSNQEQTQSLDSVRSIEQERIGWVVGTNNKHVTV